MKKVFYLYAILLMFLVTSCGYAFNHCPTYSHHNQLTKHGNKAQYKYHKKKPKRSSAWAKH